MSHLHGHTRVTLAVQTVGSTDLKEQIFAPLGPAYSNARLMKATLGDARGGGQQQQQLGAPAETSAVQDIARRVRCSAFNAAAALVASTQSQAKFYLFPLEVFFSGSVMSV